MKKLVALMLLLCVAPLLARGEGANDLSLEIRITRGERSKDSHSSTTVLTISGQTLVYRTISGRRNSGRAVAPREFKLTGEDQRKLVKLIKDRDLLRTDSIEREQDTSGIYRYFELSVKAVVKGNEGLIQIKGSRKATDLKEEKLYKDAVALVEEIYGIIHRTNEAIVYEPLIN
ncbi:MAG: hypothetical protein QOH25_2880 [Acidobacteriota bacterium]|jgi:hypothetical protein|nr:hypothetical protein [Acidobacteriota bacterium]